MWGQTAGCDLRNDRFFSRNRRQSQEQVVKIRKPAPALENNKGEDQMNPGFNDASIDPLFTKPCAREDDLHKLQNRLYVMGLRAAGSLHCGLRTVRLQPLSWRQLRTVACVPVTVLCVAEDNSKAEAQRNAHSAGIRPQIGSDWCGGLWRRSPRDTKVCDLERR